MAVSAVELVHAFARAREIASQARTDEELLEYDHLRVRWAEAARADLSALLWDVQAFIRRYESAHRWYDDPAAREAPRRS